MNRRQSKKQWKKILAKGDTPGMKALKDHVRTFGAGENLEPLDKLIYGKREAAIMQICPSCKGAKSILGIFPIYSDNYQGERKRTVTMDCDMCMGTGEVTLGFMLRYGRGQRARMWRITNSIGLHDFAGINNFEVRDVSAFENGKAIDEDKAIKIADAYKRLPIEPTQSNEDIHAV